MQKPTKEQIKEFWEWCEWKWVEDYHYVHGYMMHGWLRLPPIDLNNLFKYAPNRMTAGLWRKIIREWAATLTGDDKKDTLDLFWAIWEVKL